uniref:Uncharacterized protein n=1 Tax=Malurus cyaneus samueli TaxID=2593467 RepID=A0A8C5UAQ7_9PASS
GTLLRPHKGLTLGTMSHMSQCFPVCPCMSLCLFPSDSPCVPVFPCVSLHVPVFVSQCFPVSLCVSLCFPVFPCVPMCPCVSLCVSQYNGNFDCMYLPYWHYFIKENGILKLYF